MKTIFIVRHCEAEGQDPEAPLTKLGEKQAEILSSRFDNQKIREIVTSPYSRATQSIRPLAAKIGVRVLEDEKLKEWRLSVSPLADWQAFLRQSFSSLDICYEGGESGREAMTRSISVLRETLDSFKEGHAILVTHGGLMTLMLKHFDKRFGFSEWAHLANPDVFSLTFTEEQQYPQIERLPPINVE